MRSDATSTDTVLLVPICRGMPTQCLPESWNIAALVSRIAQEAA
ncbi:MULTISPECIES: hypothetical protein [Asaia]|nr:hypothetical protein [Asaia spathodeae]